MMKQCARTILTLAAALCIAVAAWGQNTPTQRGVVANTNVTKVNETSTTAGQVVGANQGSTVTVNVTPQANKVARVTVSPATIAATSASISGAASVTYDATTTLTVDVSPVFSDDKTVTWSCTDNRVTFSNATNVGTDGKATVTVTGAAAGSTTITASVGNVTSEAFEFTVDKAPATLYCNNSAISFAADDYVNATKTKTGVSCTGGTITVSGGSSSTFTATYSNGTITITRMTNSAISNTSVTVSVNPDNNHTAPSSVTFDVSATQAYTIMSSATSSHLGQVICSNGHIHTSSNAINCGGAASAIIAYVGSAGSVETGQSGYKGLAIALTDANGASKYQWYTVMSGTCVSQTSTLSTALGCKNGLASTNTLVANTGGCANHTHAAADAARAYSTSRPSGASQWFLPSIGQWNLIVQGLATKKAGSSVTTDLTYGDYVQNEAYKPSNLNSVITGAGGTGFQEGRYWSSTEQETALVWIMHFTYGKANNEMKDEVVGYVRAVFAF